MITVIDPRRQMLVNQADCCEIRGGESVDLDANTVVINEHTYDGPLKKTVHFPAGVKIVRKY